MNRKQLLLLLALLMTVATGAWAQTIYLDFENKAKPQGWTNSGKNSCDVGISGANSSAPAYDGNYSLYFSSSGQNDKDYFVSPAFNFQGAGSLSFAYATPAWSGDQNTLTVAYSTSSTGPWTNTLFADKTSEDWSNAYVDLSSLNGTYYIAFISHNYSGRCTAIDNINLVVSTGYSVSLKDGVNDAAKWTAKVGEGAAKPLPVGGLSEGDAVTLQYNGRLKVKSVTATTDAAPAGITVARAAYQGTNAPSQNWTKGDKLYVYGPGQVLMGTLVADADGAEVLMAGKLDFTKTGTTAPMTLTLSNLPLPMDYSTHDGQLSTVQSKMNYAMATATATAIDAEAGTVTLDAKPTLQPQQALVKLMLQNTGGTAISPSSLTVNLDASGGYSTINLLCFDVSNEGAGDWIYGGATYENGVITLPKAGGCGCGWKPALWEGVDLTKFTGATCTFALPVSGNCLFFVAYKKAGSEDQMYSPSSTVSDGATYAWVGIPSEATQILGIYFALIDPAQTDVKLYPSYLRLSKIGGFTLSPNASEVYIPFKVTEPGSTLRLDATVSGTSYSSSTTGINFAEGSYYEQTVKLAPNN